MVELISRQDRLGAGCIAAAIGCGGSLPWGVGFFNRFSYDSKSQYDLVSDQVEGMYGGGGW